MHKTTNKFCAQCLVLSNKTIRIKNRQEMRGETFFVNSGVETYTRPSARGGKNFLLAPTVYKTTHPVGALFPLSYYVKLRHIFGDFDVFLAKDRSKIAHPPFCFLFFAFSVSLAAIPIDVCGPCAKSVFAHPNVANASRL